MHLDCVCFDNTCNKFASSILNLVNKSSNDASFCWLASETIPFL